MTSWYTFYLDYNSFRYGIINGGLCQKGSIIVVLSLTYITRHLQQYWYYSCIITPVCSYGTLMSFYTTLIGFVSSRFWLIPGMEIFLVIELRDSLFTGFIYIEWYKHLHPLTIEFPWRNGDSVILALCKDHVIGELTCKHNGRVFSFGCIIY